ncbi:MAG: DUF951 family protein [Oscillospiraceae bacterium]|nr:DUF951 family protein [Oscillospiraceae bacterium]
MTYNTHMDMSVSIGELARLKKKHACGGDIFRVTYVGADIKARCEKCGAIVMLERAAFVRSRTNTKIADAAQRGET